MRGGAGGGRGAAVCACRDRTYDGRGDSYFGYFPQAQMLHRKSGKRYAEKLPMGGRRYFKEFGKQLILDAGGRTIGKEEKMLAASSGYSLSEAIRLIKEAVGLRSRRISIGRRSVFLASWVYSRMRRDLMRSKFLVRHRQRSIWEKYAFLGLPMIVSSDSHYPADIGRCRTMFKMTSACFEEFAKAIKGVDGKAVEGISRYARAFVTYSGFG